MKRVTFVLAGILMITAFVLSQKNLEHNNAKYAKTDINKHLLKDF